jgi:hypothetical protein
MEVKLTDQKWENCGTIALADQHYYLHYLILSGKYLSIARRISLYDQSFSILMSMKGNSIVKTEMAR